MARTTRLPDPAGTRDSQARTADAARGVTSRLAFTRALRIALLGAAGLLPLAASSANETMIYTYDARGRLTGVAHSGTVNNGVVANYQYDSADNRKNVTVTASAAPTFSIGNASATEGGQLAFTVTRSGTATGTYTVNYATADGSAKVNSDYNAAGNTLTFTAAGSQTVNVSTINDSAAEPTEAMYVNLSGASGGASISTAQGTGTITDNDSTPISFKIDNAAAVSEGGTLNFYVTKSGSTASNYTVNYATANGSADGSDYTAKFGTLTFAPGDVSLPIPVQTTDDNVYEGDETVLVNLSNASGGATISTAQASGTIPGNDLHPPITVNDTKSMGKCAIATINLTANDSDPDGFLPLKITALAGGPAIHATIVSDSSIEFDAQVPAGQYAITYTIQDTRGSVAQATGTVTITVTGTQVCA